MKKKLFNVIFIKLINIFLRDLIDPILICQSQRYE